MIHVYVIPLHALGVDVHAGQPAVVVMSDLVKGVVICVEGALHVYYSHVLTRPPILTRLVLAGAHVGLYAAKITTQNSLARVHVESGGPGVPVELRGQGVGRVYGVLLRHRLIRYVITKKK